MAKAVQVHMKTRANTSPEYGVSEVNVMTWVETSLKPRAGMMIETKGDKRAWEIVAVYTIPAEMDGLAKWAEVARVGV